MDNQIKNRILGLSSLIGNTPLLAIHFQYKGTQRVVYAKLESQNLTGSIKDRMAFFILRKALERGDLQPGQRIIEATSGNTGISFSAIGKALGNEVTIYMPNWLSSERVKIIQSLGCEIVLVSKEEGGFLGSIAMSEDHAVREGGFLPRQFSNEDNVDAHYTTTAPELWWQLKYNGIAPDAFVAGVGTGGTVMGVGKFLKEQNPNILVHPAEPSNSPTLTTGYKIGKHRIQGISDEFIPQIVDLRKLDSVVAVDDGDSIIMSQQLARIGIPVGISSGANFLAAIKVQEQIGWDKVVVTVFSDGNKKYLSTDYACNEPILDGFISTGVKLNYYSAFKRVCYTCCNPENCREAQFMVKHGSNMQACPGRK